MPELSPFAEDALMAAALLAIPALCGLVVLWGYRPWVMIRALMRRAAGTSVLFVALMAVSLALGLILTAQERALRQASASATDPFDVMVTAPGSEVTALLATVFLQPSDIPLLTGAQMAEIAATDGVRLAAPLGFGDSIDGLPIVGTTADFVTHLSGELAEGRVFQSRGEVVVGALAPFSPGTELEPAHGVGAGAEDHAHEGQHLLVVGRMAPTGGAWDRSVVAPIETLWEMHGLPDGHPLPASPEGDHDRHHGHDQGHIDARPIGPPWLPELLPGVPAMVIDTGQLAAAYAIRSALSRPDMMAFFPGALLSQLHGVLGDVRSALSILAIAAQALVTIAVLGALTLVMALFAGQFALLRDMGAPTRFVLAVAWGFAAMMILAGTLGGIALALIGLSVASDILSGRLGLAIHASLGWPEVHMIAGFVCLMLLAALMPAWRQLRRTRAR